MNPGIYPGLTYNQYEAIPALRWSVLRHGMRSMAHLNYAAQHPAEDKRHFLLGRALHCAVLEPAQFGCRYISEPEDAPKKPTAAQRNAKTPSPETLAAIEYWTAWVDGPAAGKDVLTPSELVLVQAMANAVHADPVAGPIVALPGHRELTIVWDDPETGIRCKARPDLVVPVASETWVINLKSARTADPADFPRDIWNLRYHCQTAFEAFGLDALSPHPRRFGWIVVEKEPPHCVVLYEPTPQMLRQGRNEIGRLLAAYADARRTGIWPGYVTGIWPVDLPRYAKEPGYDE